MAGLGSQLVDLTIDSDDSDDAVSHKSFVVMDTSDLGAQLSAMDSARAKTAAQSSTIEIAETTSESSSDDDLPPEYERAELTEEEIVVTEGAELEAHNYAMAAKKAARRATFQQSEQRKSATLQVDLKTVDHHFPLPQPPTRFLAHDHTYATYHHPLDAHQRWMKDSQYAQAHLAQEPRRIERQRDQRRRDGTDWSTTWSLEGYGEAGGRASGTCVAFFPFPEYAGLSSLHGVFATVAANVVQLWQARERKDPARASVEDRYEHAGVLVAQSTIGNHEAMPENAEDLLALAWSVNISTWPFTPILAVGGTGRAIHVFKVKIRERVNTSVALVYDRTIVGHGGPITDLKFSPSHPHLLVSASVDRTARLINPTVPLQALVDMEAPNDNILNGSGRKTKQKGVARYGETLGIFANDGHTKPLLSVDIHPRFPLIVTSGLDGKVLLWTFPTWLRGPAFPVDGEELYIIRPVPVSNISLPPLFDAPIFSSTSIHDNWCDQVLFASHSTVHIISKAGRPATDCVPVPGKEVKLWCPTILDRNSSDPTPRSQFLDDDDPSAFAHLLSQRGSTFPDGADRKPISSAYRVYRRIDLEDSNALQDRMGLHLLPLDAEDPSALLDTALFIATANEPSLYAFRPFGPLPTPVPSGEGGELSVAEEREARLEALLARGADRALYDMEPRLRPSVIMDVKQQKVATWSSTPAGKKGEMRLRCIAVQPNGAKWVVGLGDDGLLLIWRRRGDGV